MANPPRNAPRAANDVKKCCRAEHASGGAFRGRRFVFAPMIRSSSHPHVQNALSHFRQCAGEKGSYLTYGQCRQKQPGHANPGAGYDGHKSPGYQLQVAQSYGEENEVNLITACLPQSAAESDSAALIPVPEAQADHGLQPEKLLADTAYGSDENVETCREAGIELISPVAGKSPATATAAAAGPGTPARLDPDTKSGGVPPVPPDKPENRQERLEQRRASQQTEAWKKEYAKRSGQEGVNRALDRVTGIKQLVVRGKEAVTMALYLKTIGWNLLKAGQTCARRGIAARQMEPQTA